MPWRRSLALALASLALAACGSPYYTSDPIEAWVVDADTGRPIEGAVVTANWQLVSASLDTGGRKLRQLEVLETTTDKDGRFYFPGFTKINFTLDELREEDPQILIFKSGYQYFRAINSNPTGGEPSGTKRSSVIHGKTIRLGLGSNDPVRYALQLRPMMASVENIAMLDGATRVPRLLKALTCEKYRIKAIDKTIPFSIPAEPENVVNCDEP